MFGGIASMVEKSVLALMLGEGEFKLGSMIIKKLESSGEELIKEHFSLPSIGLRGLHERGEEVLHRLKPHKGAILRAIERILSGYYDSTPGARRPAQWQRGGWARSRREWLAEKWRHDWESQPRNPAGGPQHWSGAWTRGRLSYPMPSKFKASRRIRKQRKVRAVYRRAGRKAVKGIVSSWASSQGNN